MGLSKEPRIGDRFKDTYDTCVYEYLGNSKFLNLESNAAFEQGGHPKHWAMADIDFIGNFAKSSNFTNLYDILCENPKYMEYEGSGDDAMNRLLEDRTPQEIIKLIKIREIISSTLKSLQSKIYEDAYKNIITMKKLYNTVRAKGLVWIGLIFALLIYIQHDSSSDVATVSCLVLFLGLFAIINIIDYVKRKTER